MRGCAKLFPQSRIAAEELRLRKKADERTRNGWKLSRRDEEALAAINQFYAGEINELYALQIVDSAKHFNGLYRGRR